MEKLDNSLVPCSKDSGSPAEMNALFYVPVNPFVYKHPPVPNHAFEPERLKLLSEHAETQMIVLDLSNEMQMPYPATTPNMLARYLTIASNDQLSYSFNAVVNIYYVMSGSGMTRCGETELSWAEGDVFLLPGGVESIHTANGLGATLYLVTDEPMLSFTGTSATKSNAKIFPTFFSAKDIDLNLQKTYERGNDGTEAAKSVWFTNRQMYALRTTSPHITANFNTLPAGEDQRPHRHNAAALTLSIEGDNVHSLVDGQKTDWRKFGVMVTPPSALHSHHNRGDRTMRSFVVQDSGLHYYSRTTGFRFDR